MKCKLMSFDWIVNSLIVHNLLCCVTVFCSYWQMFFKLGDLKVEVSPSKKKLGYLLDWKLFKNDEKCFLFHLKNFFHSQDKFLSQLFCHKFWSYRKNSLISQNSWRHKLVYKQLQYTYCLISHKVKATGQWNLVN